MGKHILLPIIGLLMVVSIVSAQQVPDLKYKPPLPRPAYKAGKGPRVVIDEAHHNFHTCDGRYKPFAELLRRDGYRVDGLRQPLSAESLKGVQILVIANPLHERNANDWSPPNPSAFTRAEIDALHTWIEKGGSLFLIADHPPFPGAAGELARAFGVEFSNGYAQAGHWQRGPDTFTPQMGLKENAITRGRSDDEKVSKVTTFAGSAFKLPEGAIPVLVFGPKSESVERKEVGKARPETRKVPIEGWCQGAVLKAGKGRVAVFGEAAMFSAQLAGPRREPMGMNAPEASQNYKLLLNVLHWLSRAEGMAD